jgi:hypothetical protein
MVQGRGRGDHGSLKLEIRVKQSAVRVKDLGVGPPGDCTGCGRVRVDNGDQFGLLEPLEQLAVDPAEVPGSDQGETHWLAQSCST